MPHPSEIAALRKLVAEMEHRSAPLPEGARAIIGHTVYRLRQELADLEAAASRANEAPHA